MKNMFKLMGVALLAGAMLFTACKKDKEDTTPNTPTPAISVTFAGDSWSCDEVMDYEEMSGDRVKCDIYKDADAEEATIQFCCKAAVDEYSFANSDYYVVYKDGATMYNSPSADGKIVISAISIQDKTMSGSITAAFGEKNLAVTLTNAKWE